MTEKFEKLSARNGLIEFPLTFADLKEAINQFPKSERSYYELSFKAIKHLVKDKEKIYFITSGDSKLLNSGGFIIVTDKLLILTHLKNSIRAKAEVEFILYNSIKDVDYDLATINVSWVGAASLILKIQGIFGVKDRTIMNIPKEDIDFLVNIIKLKMGVISENEVSDSIELTKSSQPRPSGFSVADELRKLADLRDQGILTDEEFQTEKRKILTEY